MKTLDELLIEAGTALDERCAEVAGSVGLRTSTEPRVRWLAVSAAAALVAVSGVAFWAARDERPDDVSLAATPSAPESSAVPVTTVPTDSTIPVTPSTTSAVTVSTTFDGSVALGSSGDDVLLVEQRLHDLGFFVGEIDGEFDGQTEQAVWAWKKLVDGRSWQDFADDLSKSTVTPETWLRMSENLDVAPRRPSGDSSTRVEVYLPQQVLVVFAADEPVLIAHISSGKVDDDGSPITFCEVMTFDIDSDGQPIDPPEEQAICANSKTPGGVFQITRRHDGTRTGELGAMYRPQYFNYGIAIYGAQNVPARPVSHGAIRVTNAAADELWDILDTGDEVYVWGQDGQEPESYTKDESMPIFPYVDPSATPST